MTETKRKTLVVDESGAGDYRTLTEAVAACAATPDEPVRVYICLLYTSPSPRDCS